MHDILGELLVMNAYIQLQAFLLNFDCFCKILMTGFWTHLSRYVMPAYSL